ncbi:Aldo/keto reductase [Metschnikowia bicuspidata var. bicuspidata NRRL YB-4993]|uniref:Aldo/keto reductase n=1 Tax=Metschnikowia bicuspidata var. bicuspidata NRRL YB-4993 TaxID=869754 RepID=A0A1A0HFJ7_9ASCO|nr:Aldo/keto reductase [Metschnikowia bicuspidata var. bicuspidata NRRL YB-4993]OBA22924.1 Aldo/keto reductase [Metschnikowia bicuspidata var. bicuspidata NRRL YB-4993]
MTPVNIPGKFGYGSMSLTWTPTPKTEAEAIQAIKYVLDKHQVRFVNGGEFYGPDSVNLKYLGAFWKHFGCDYPDLVISVKGSIDVTTLKPDGSRESISRSINNFVSYFPQNKLQRPKLIFEIARVDTSVPYEQTIGFINEFVGDGVIDGISLSEVGVGSIEKALSVAPISSVEVEFSLLCQDIFSNGVLKKAAEENLTIVAYSPLCRGFLTDRSADDFSAFFDLCHQPGDIRGHIDRFSKENFFENLKIVAKLKDYAETKGTTLESLAISWIVAYSELENYNGISKFPKIIPIPSGSSSDKIDQNLGQIVSLSKADLDDIKKITDCFEVKGYRYNAKVKHLDFA